MRILIVVSSLTLGGAQRQITLLAKELVRLGHAVCIYTLTQDIPRKDELAGSNVDLVVDQKRRRLDFSVLHRLRAQIRTWRPDIVHGFLYDGNFYSRLACAGARLPVLNSERNDNYSLSLIKRTGNWLTRRLCDGYVANSHAGAEFARRIHRADADVVHVVWNGIDLDEIEARLAVSTEPAKIEFPGDHFKRLCLVGAIKPQKDYPLALRVMRRLVDHDSSWRLICVGDKLEDAGPEHKEYVMAEYRRLQLEPFVKFLGHRRDVPELVASSELLLVTSVHEGFPNVVLEAMACGTAVVSTEYSDIRRILPSSDQIVASRDADEVADAAMDCYKKRATLAAAQREWVNSHGTVLASAEALLHVYAKYVVKPATVLRPACSGDLP